MSQPPVPLLEGEVLPGEGERALYAKGMPGLAYHALCGRYWLTTAGLLGGGGN
jgi:hypothetical protein